MRFYNDDDLGPFFTEEGNEYEQRVHDFVTSFFDIDNLTKSDILELQNIIMDEVSTTAARKRLKLSVDTRKALRG